MTRADREAYREKIERHIDAGTCHICGQAVLDGTPVHGLTGAHYDCEVPDRSKLTALTVGLFHRDPAPQPSGVFRELIPKGGSLVHIVDTGTNQAICGYVQQNTAARMRKRSGWYKYNPDAFKAPGFPQRFCQGCEAKFNQLQEKTCAASS